MNDLCTCCGQKMQATNTVLITRDHVASSAEQLLGLGRKRNRPRDGKYGEVYQGEGLCDKCASRVIEMVRSMQDFTARQ